jgi:hypothetical protein
MTKGKAPELPIVQTIDGAERATKLKPIPRLCWTYSKDVEILVSQDKQGRAEADTGDGPCFRDAKGELMGGFFFAEPAEGCMEGQTFIFSMGKCMSGWMCTKLFRCHLNLQW